VLGCLLYNKNKDFGRLNLRAPRIRMSEFDKIVDCTLEGANISEKDKNSFPNYVWTGDSNNKPSEVLGCLLYNRNYDFCRGVKEDLLPFSFSSQDYNMTNKVMTDYGVPVIEYTAFYDYGPGTVMYFYHDGNGFRAFVPYLGNYIDVDRGTELYQDLQKDLPYLEKQGIKVEGYGITKDSNPESIYSSLKYAWRKNKVEMNFRNEYPSPNYRMCIKDMNECFKKGCNDN
jgi:hypothetical protein